MCGERALPPGWNASIHSQTDKLVTNSLGPNRRYQTKSVSEPVTKEEPKLKSSLASEYKKIPKLFIPPTPTTTPVRKCVL